MTALEVALLIIGAIFLVASFFVSEKLSSSDLDEIKKMSEQEIKTILQSNMEQASTEIENRIQEKEDEAMESLERKTDKETNDKIMEISEFSDTVLDAMNKSHNEIIFMYDMLNDKQEHATELMKDLQMMQSAILQMGEAVEEKRLELQELVEKQIEVTLPEQTEQTEELPEPISMEEALKEHQKDEQKEDIHNNEAILNLYEQGVSEIEIAKQLGCGLGEVKLVLGLFRSGERA
jgi:uncharacterized protein YneF (UPF0154 family)